MKHYDCLIIGAGITGLTAATKLIENDIDAIIVDKSRGIGGRMATRRFNNYRFDHGAQSLSITNHNFLNFIEKNKKDDIIQPVDYSVRSENNEMIIQSFAAKNGISSIAKLISSGLNIRYSFLVEKIIYKDSMWHVISEMQEELRAKSLIITAPIPQTLSILKKSNILNNNSIEKNLSKIEYDSCIAILAIYNTDRKIFNSPFIKLNEEPFYLIIDNFAKGVSPTPGAITFHTSIEFSNIYLEKSDAEISDLVYKESFKYVDLQPEKMLIHRWRYSRNTNSYHKNYEIIDFPGLIALAGDGFKGTDIEGAYFSGLDAGRAIIDFIKN